MGLFSNLFKKTELDIFLQEIKPSDKILVVGPMGDYTAGDPTLPILLRFVNVASKNIFVIDYKHCNTKHAHFDPDLGDKIPTSGDLHKTQKCIYRIAKEIPHLVIANALSLPFSKNSFDIIVDRMTHQWIVSNGGDLKKLISEYLGVLKKDGKILFFDSEERKIKEAIGAMPCYTMILEECERLKLKVRCGPLALNKDQKYQWKNESYFIQYIATHYIIIEK